MDKYGVIGWPIEHSLSPAMHNAAFKALGIDAKYEKIQVRPEELEDFLLKNREYKGFNITVPHKVRAREILKDKVKNTSTEVTQFHVRLTGAVNTVKKVNNVWDYANTDVTGFLTSLAKDLRFDFVDKSVFLLGCGGAGRAVIAGLGHGKKAVKKIYAYDSNENILNATKGFFSQFSEVAQKLEFIFGKNIYGVLKNCQLLVNATPMGMKKGDPSVIDKNLLHSEISVYDVVYNRETGLVKDAKSMGLEAVNGLGMLLYQGVKALEFWLDKPVPGEAVNTMKAVLIKGLA